MLWFITLLVLALAAFFIIKAFKSHSARQSAEDQRLREGSGLAGSLNHETHSSTASNTVSAVNTGASGTSGTSGTSGVSKPVAAGIAAVAGAAAVAVTAKGTSQTSTAQQDGLNTGDTSTDVQEMIKILNLAEPDAGRLNISRDQFNALRSGNSSAAPASDQLNDVAAKLRNMLA